MYKFFMELFPKLILNNTLVYEIVEKVASILEEYNNKIDKQLNNDI